MTLPRVLVLFNEPTLPADHPDAESEHDILFTADAVSKVLQDAGLPVFRLGLTDDPGALIEGLKSIAPDVVFNLYEGMAKWGNTEAFVAGVLEMLRIPFTGSPTQPLILARSKPLTKSLLAGSGLPTAGFRVVEALPVPPCDLPWPVIVKPGKEDASVGIDQTSVVTCQADLEARVGYVLTNYGPPVLIEQFVRGREFNVAVWDRHGTPETLPFAEILFLNQDAASPLWPIVSFDAKWRPDTADYLATPPKTPAEVEPALHAKVAALAIQAFTLVGCRDYARVDFRVAEDGSPYILEVNPNPCISPLAGLAGTLEAAQIPYGEFILTHIRSALRRGPKPELADVVAMSAPTVIGETPAAAAAVPAADGWTLRPARGTDLDDFDALIETATALNAAEKKQAMLAVRTVAQRERWDDITVLVQAGRPRMAGFALADAGDDSHGVHTVPLLVVDPSLRRSGCGSRLLQSIEHAAIAAGRRLVLTSLTSGPAAAPGRQFLLHNAYRPAGEVPEFYKDGTARLTYAKMLTPPTDVDG